MNAVSEVKDLTGMTEAVLTQAIEYCTQKVRLDNSQAVIDRLREGWPGVRVLQLQFGQAGGRIPGRAG